LSASLRCVLDLIQRRGVFERGCVAEFFAEIRGAYDAAHHFCVTCFCYVTYKNRLAWRKRLAMLGGERVF